MAEFYIRPIQIRQTVHLQWILQQLLECAGEKTSKSRKYYIHCWQPGIKGIRQAVFRNTQNISIDQYLILYQFRSMLVLILAEYEPPQNLLPYGNTVSSGFPFNKVDAKLWDFFFFFFFRINERKKWQSSIFVPFK